jgi:hypothetical protein
MGVTENRIEQIQRHIRKCYSSTPKDLELGQTRFGRARFELFWTTVENTQWILFLMIAIRDGITVTICQWFLRYSIILNANFQFETVYGQD